MPMFKAKQIEKQGCS